MTREQRDELAGALEERAGVDGNAEAAAISLRADRPLERADWETIYDAIDVWRLAGPVPEIARVAHGEALTHLDAGAS